MSKCFSFTSTRDAYYRYSFTKSGLKSTTKSFTDGTTIHCWSPKTPKPHKPNLLLLHGLGANAMWQWDYFISPLVSKFNVYVPDLLFFGGSYTTRPERDDKFQAQSVMRMMGELGVAKMSVAGISYGGFVAYCIAEMFEDAVEKVVIMCSGVCLEERDIENGLFEVRSVEEAADVLLPLSSGKLRELLRLSFYKPVKLIPTCFLDDFVEVMCKENIEERKQLMEALHKGRKLENLPQINQSTLIIWGEHDRVFPIELAHRLKRHLGENAELVIIKKAGHAVNMEKPKQLYKYMKCFLLNKPLPKSANQSNGISAK